MISNILVLNTLAVHENEILFYLMVKPLKLFVEGTNTALRYQPNLIK